MIIVSKKQKHELEHLIGNTFDGAVENDYKLEDFEYQDLRKHFIENVERIFK